MDDHGMFPIAGSGHSLSLPEGAHCDLLQDCLPAIQCDPQCLWGKKHKADPPRRSWGGGSSPHLNTHGKDAGLTDTGSLPNYRKFSPISCYTARAGEGKLHSYTTKINATILSFSLVLGKAGFCLMFYFFTFETESHGTQTVCIQEPWTSDPAMSTS